jgi:hypothetical protein
VTKAFVHGLTQGIFSQAMGGDFRGGFVGGFFGSLTGPGVPDNVVTGTLVSAMIGGTISELTGGKFRNGARSAAMVHLFNELGKGHGNKGGDSLTEDEKEEIAESLRTDLIKEMEEKQEYYRRNVPAADYVKVFGGRDQLAARENRAMMLTDLDRKMAFVKSAEFIGSVKATVESFAGMYGTKVLAGMSKLKGFEDRVPDFDASDAARAIAIKNNIRIDLNYNYGWGADYVSKETGDILYRQDLNPRR